MSELNPAPRRLPADLDYLSSIDEIIEDAREGRMFVLVDDQDRENEGDLVIPAQMATPEAINFMATHGRGLICLSLTQERVDELGLTPMDRRNTSRFDTAFMVSIEAKEGVTTGISAPDRAHTIQIAIDPTHGAADIIDANQDRQHIRLQIQGILLPASLQIRNGVTTDASVQEVELRARHVGV